MACTKRLLEWIAGWLPRHCIGAILVSLPALAVYSHVTSEFETNIHFPVFTGSAALIAVVHYCNFCQLSSWMRSSLATVVGAGPLLLLYVSLCPDRYAAGTACGQQGAWPPFLRSLRAWLHLHIASHV